MRTLGFSFGAQISRAKSVIELIHSVCRTTCDGCWSNRSGLFFDLRRPSDLRPDHFVFVFLSLSLSLWCHSHNLYITSVAPPQHHAQIRWLHWTQASVPGPPNGPSTSNNNDAARFSPKSLLRKPRLHSPHSLDFLQHPYGPAGCMQYVT